MGEGCLGRRSWESGRGCGGLGAYVVLQSFESLTLALPPRFSNDVFKMPELSEDFLEWQKIGAGRQDRRFDDHRLGSVKTTKIAFSSRVDDLAVNRGSMTAGLDEGHFELVPTTGVGQDVSLDARSIDQWW